MNKPETKDVAVTRQASDRRSFIKNTVLGASAVAAAGLAASTSAEASQERQIVQKKALRGSEKLLERLGSAGRTYSVQDLRQVVGVAKKHNVKVVNWCQLGQPAVDGVCGTFEVKPDLAGRVLGDLIGLASVIRFRFDVFPLGIPAVDVVRLDFRAGRLGVE